MSLCVSLTFLGTLFIFISSEGGFYSGLAKGPIDLGLIHIEPTILDEKYENSSHTMRKYAISNLQFQYTHLDC